VRRLAEHKTEFQANEPARLPPPHGIRRPSLCSPDAIDHPLAKAAIAKVVKLNEAFSRLHLANEGRITSKGAAASKSTFPGLLHSEEKGEERKEDSIKVDLQRRRKSPRKPPPARPAAGRRGEQGAPTNGGAMLTSEVSEAESSSWGARI